MQKLFLQLKRRFKDQRGVTVLIASLVASILLAIGLSIFNTTIKDLTFASSGNQSSIAFYAADTAAECALYFDYQNIFATSSASLAVTTSPNSAKDCNTQDITRQHVPPAADDWAVSAVTSSQAVTTFYLTSVANSPTGICATVVVTKTDAGGGNSNTLIESYGYNNCTQGDPRRVERGVQLKY